MSSLRVISRTSVMPFKGAGKSLTAIAKKLRVDAIVEGSIARSGDKVRITAQLIHVATDAHRWSGRYEREVQEILSLQAEIAEDVAGHIQRLLDPQVRGSVAQRKVQPQAFEACLKGIYFRDKLTPMDLMKSIGCFEQAMEFDRGYAPAYAHAAQSYFYLGLFGVGATRELFPKARLNALKAFELDETVAIAHNAMAAIHILYDWDWARAELECTRAMELNPSDSSMHAHRADYISIQGRHEEAIAALEFGLELDPISRVYIGFFGLILYRARRYDESIEQCRKALEIDPYYVNARWFLALSLEKKGQLGESIAQLTEVVRLAAGSHFLSLLGRARALAGDRAGALQIIEELKALSLRQYVSPFDFAVVQVGLGDLSSTFSFLEAAYSQRVFRIIGLTMPMFDDLRSDSRWQSLVQRIGLPVWRPSGHE